MWYVYILRSKVDDSYYKGYTSDYLKRLEEHNQGLSQYTSGKRPWELCYVEICPSKTEAIKRELLLKRQNSKYLLWLFEQKTNILKK